MTEKDSYFMFKLVSGEEIISLTTMDDSGIEPCFFLENPLKVELSHKGNHILGDKKYKKKFKKIKKINKFLEKIILGLNRQFLHAKIIGFIHPSTGKKLEFSSILPEELEKILKNLRNTNK